MDDQVGFGTRFKEDARILIEAGRYEEVLRIADRLLALSIPDVFVAELHRARARAYIGLSDREEALVEWTRVLKILPSDAEAYAERGAVREALGDSAGAALDSACAAEARSREVVPGGARTDSGAAMWNRVTAAYAATADSHCPSLRGYCCCRKNTRGQNANCGSTDVGMICTRAEDDCTLAIRMDPSDARAYLHRAFVRACRRNHEGTESDCTRAVELDPGLSEAYCLRGTVYEKCGELERAVADWTRTIELNPRDVYAYSLRELAYEELGEEEKAAADGRRAFDLNNPRCSG